MGSLTLAYFRGARAVAARRADPAQRVVNSGAGHLLRATGRFGRIEQTQPQDTIAAV